ncbi:MAG: protein kinase [Saccharothrix sp.]|nr:protein kinase [Saccharothrix sp.]
MSDNVLAGRYRLDEPLGSGVHRGWDQVLRRRVAIKVFPPGLDAATARRLAHEVRALAALSHPALVAVYDADTDGGRPFVVMQLVEGRTLREEIDRGPLPPDRVRRLGADLADALAHTHDHGLVDRAVRPSNVLLDDEGNPHLAPERGSGPVDVHALGLVLLACLTGRRDDAPAIPDHLPADLRDLLAKMTAPTPTDRPTPHDCARALAAPAGRSSTNPPTAASSTADRFEADPSAVDSAAADTEVIPGPRRVWKALTGSTVALLAAMAITLALKPAPEPATSDPAAPPGPEPAAQPTSTGTPGADRPEGTAVPVLAPPPKPSDTPRPTTGQSTTAPATPSPSAPLPTSAPVTTETPTTTTAPEPTTTPAPTTESSSAEGSEEPTPLP